VVYDLKEKRFYAALLGGALILLLISLPVRSFKAEYKYREAVSIIDDKETEHLDMLVISEETIGDYTEAIAATSAARGYLPMKSSYARREARLYKMLGVWGETMLSLGEALPGGVIEPPKAYARAEELFLEAVAREPTNADYHLALAGLYDIMKSPVDMDKELRRVVLAYPRNAPLRHLVAMRYLLAGMPGDALEHARVLAGMDEGYLPAVMKEGDEARRLTQWDLKKFYKSYLFAAFEIAWRVSKIRMWSLVLPRIMSMPKRS
jgi:tetratricopeptide (TPR) repeat protein